MKILKGHCFFKGLYTSLAVICFLFIFGLAFGRSASAETNTPITASAPTPNSGTTDTGADFTPISGVGRGQFNGDYMWYKIYLKVGQSTTVNVNQTCADNFGSPTVEYTLESLGDGSGAVTEQDYSGNQGNFLPAVTKKSSDCTQTISFNIGSTAGIASKIRGHEDYRVFALYAFMEPGPGSAEQYFTVTSSAGTGDSYVGMSRPDITKLFALKFSTVYKTSGTWSYSIMFAPKCGENVSNPVSILIKDPDNGIYQNNMRAFLESSPSPGAINWSTQTSWTAQQVQGVPNGYSWGQSNTVGTLSFNVDNDHIYKFHVLDSSHPNTIQIKLPFDQFDARSSVRDLCNNSYAAACVNISIDKTFQPPGTAANINMTFRNTGKSDWTSGFYIKRTGPSYKNIKTISGTIGPTGTVSATDSIIYPNQLTTYTYLVFTNTDQQIASNCNIAVNPQTTPRVTSCDALPDKTVLPVWDGNPATQAASQTNIKVTLYNGENYTFPGGINGYTVRQVKNAADPASAPNGGLRYLSRNLPSGQTDYDITPFNIAARTTPVTLNFYYTLFTGDQAGNPSVGKSPLCHTTITWGTNPPGGGNPGGRLNISCSSTATTGVYVPATYHPALAPYETYIPPGSWAAFPSGPPQAFPPYTGTHYTYTPPAGSGPAKPITVVPARIHVQDLNDGRQWDYRFTNGVPNGTSLGAGATSAGVSTFGLGSQAGQTMWPHHQYQLTLFMEGSQAPTDSTTYQNNGAPGSYSEAQFDQQPTPTNCLTASCIAGSDADIEPGQKATLKGGIQFNNQTQETYATDNSNGYNMRIDTSGGFSGAPGAPVPTSGPIGPGGSSSVQFSFDTLVNWSGSYNWTLLFGSDPLGLSGLAVPCPGNTVTPSTRPFFQVWGGDINTGGGFNVQNNLTGAFSCPASYPGYVSPAVPGVIGEPSNYGGIKAFGSADGTYGSFSDFGAVAFGIIAQNPTGSVPAPPFINFSANPKFSNNSTSNSSGGQFEGIPSKYDCMPDFFDATQNNPTPIGSPSTVNLNSLVGTSQQYIVNGGNIDNLLGGTIPAGIKITIFVDGDVTIRGDITYSAWSAVANNSPSFTLIAKGNINIDPAVKRLDGLYIAQPRSPGFKGEFNTCADNSGNQFCNQQLVVNGAVITRQLLLLRSIGTVSPDANPNFSPAPGHNAAEIFNYIPSMVISSPNFKALPSQDQARFNLPPVF